MGLGLFYRDIASSHSDQKSWSWARKEREGELGIVDLCRFVSAPIVMESQSHGVNYGGISWFEEIGTDVERDMDGTSVIISLQFLTSSQWHPADYYVGWSGLQLLTTIHLALRRL
jgi:hypothetical protein